MLDDGWVLVHRARFFGHRTLWILGTTSGGGVCAYACVVCVCVCMCVRVCVQIFTQDFRFGGGTQHLGGSGGMFPQEFFWKANALRLILGNFLVPMHILANTYPCKIEVFCCNYAK